LPAHDVENTARRLFNVLAEEAARLILPSGKAKGKSLLSRWLIHLAEQPGSRRLYLGWPRPASTFSLPHWGPVTPLNPPTNWWAIRLSNVFLLSRDVIGIATSRSAPVTDITHPDGPEGGRWVWWNNKRYDVPQGTVYRLLEHMWGRDSASYDSLEDAKVIESAVAPQTVRSYANKANNALPVGFPWRLATDSNARQLTKLPAAK
jgi:hypothetical protein